MPRTRQLVCHTVARRDRPWRPLYDIRIQLATIVLTIRLRAAIDILPEELIQEVRLVHRIHAGAEPEQIVRHTREAVDALSLPSPREPEVSLREPENGDWLSLKPPACP